MRIVRILLLILLLLGIGVFSFQLYQQETQKRALQEELIELSKAKYGLFSVDEWKTIITEIMVKKVGEYQVGETDEAVLRQKVSAFLYEAIATFKERYKERNDQESGLGFLKNMGLELVNIFGEFEKEVPFFTEHILGLMEAPENQADLQAFVLQQLNHYVDETPIIVDYSLRDSLLAKYDAPDVLLAQEKVAAEIATNVLAQQTNRTLLFSLIGVALILMLVLRQPSKHEFLLVSAMASILLVWGVLLPMISIDARVADMRFVLAGEEVGFSNQVLYFKSKSILEVVELMMAQSEIELIAVGFLVLAFSVLFPVAKLGSSVLYLYAEKLRSAKILRFLVFKTAKWSMADVMVVTIMMTYLGFGSILGEQLKQLDTTPGNVDIITTGFSTLEVGFYLFLGFVLLSLMVSHRMQYSLKTPETSETE